MSRHRMGWRGAVILTMVLAMATAHATGIWAPAGYEQQPVLQASELAAPELLKGARFQVDERVPTDDFLARFTVRSDFGSFEAPGLDILKIRIAELAALGQLEVAIKTETLKARASGMEHPGKRVENFATRAIGTAADTPLGVERFFGRVKLGPSSVMATATAPGGSSTEQAEEVGRRVGGMTVDALRYEQERRQLAKHLRVDPYTTNPVLADKLDRFARMTFSGGGGVNTVISALVPPSIAISATPFPTDLVWDTPAAELLHMNDQKLRAMGLSEVAVRALLGNPWHSLSVLTALVTALDQLQGVSWRDTIAALAASAASEDQARFVTAATQMLVRYHKTVAPLKIVMGRGTVIGQDQRGVVVVPAPLDYVAWTERIADFAKRTDLRAQDRGVWLTGQASPRAQHEMTQLRWTLQDGGRLRRSQSSRQ